MKIRYVEIRNFRGIKELDWAVCSDMVCLIGPGSSCKSTILDAIGFALSPRWTIPFTDDDFHKGDSSEPILIRVTVDDLPKMLTMESSFGLHLRGWDVKTACIIDEPRDDLSPVITVQLMVDDSLEPRWSVVNNRDPEGKTLTSRHRASLGVAALGALADRDLSWARGSALARVSTDVDEVANTLAEASRAVRNSVISANLSELEKAAQTVKGRAAEAGATTRGRLHAGLDLHSVSLTSSVLGLFDEGIPVRQDGLGNRRLFTLAIQRQLTEDGAILLIDELEFGLEPSRVRRLVSYLRPAQIERHQVFSSTHSPIALVEHRASEIHIVRETGGIVSVIQVPASLQGCLRSLQEAFFGRKVILCEGSTEWGFSRALEQHWIREGYPPFTHQGTVFAYSPNKGGSSVSAYALSLQSLGYTTALLCDSDCTLSPSITELESKRVAVFQWATGNCIETQVFCDVSMTCVERLVNLACELSASGEAAVWDSVSDAFHVSPKLTSFAALCARGPSESEIREGIGRLAKKKGWYKSTSGGESFGRLVLEDLSDGNATTLSSLLRNLRAWVYE